jgi:hypothetical protein
VARYEAGVSSPSVSTLERLLQAAGAQLVVGTALRSAPIDRSGTGLRLLRKHRSEIERLARSAGARNVRVFGSVARGDETVESDIDLLVDFPVHELGVLPLVRLRRQLSELLGCEVDVTTEELLRPEILEQAVREAVSV